MQQLLIGIGTLCDLAECVCLHWLETGVCVCTASCTLMNKDHFSEAFCMIQCQQPGAMQEVSKHLTSMYLHLIHQHNTRHGDIVSMHMPSRECTCTASCSPKGST